MEQNVTMPPNRIGGGQIKWISSLRGFLVFFVFFSHLTILPINKDLMFIIGRIGVSGFFLISGYLAVTSLGKRNTKQFLFNRFMRLYPIYWLLLILTFLIGAQISFKELAWNFTLFEKFVGYKEMIGSSWMLPIMVIFFALLPLVKGDLGRVSVLFYIMCAGSIAIGCLRYITGKPFPTAICLLTCVGLLGWIQKATGELMNKRLAIHIAVFEVCLIIASVLSYGDKVYWYFVAYNIGFLFFFLFQKFNVHFTPSEKLGELGFTFFLGAGIPMLLMDKLLPSFASMNCYALAIIKFILAILFSYVITRWCEKPLLAWGKQVEHRLE